MMDDGYISELVKQFKESISQEESELVDKFKEYLQIAIMSIKNNKSKFLNIIPYLSISSKETLINKFQIINSKKLQKEIDSVMDILLTDNVSK